MGLARLQKRLERTERVLVRTEEHAASSVPPATSTAATGQIARELAASFGEMVRVYRDYYKVSPDEARSQASECSEQYLERAMTAPPDQVSWSELDALSRWDETKMWQRWNEMLAAARGDVSTGFRGARALEAGVGDAWQRACYAGLRAELTDGWCPRNTVEQHLVDQLAAWQTLLWQWQEILAGRTAISARGCRRTLRENQEHDPRLSHAEAEEHATRMVERYHGLYLRTLRMLKELKQMRPAVVVRSAKQVNVAGQQVNVAR